MESHFQPVLPACSWVAAFQFCRAHIRYPEAPRFLLPPELPCWNSRTSNPGRLRLTINLNSPWKINSQGCSSRKDPAAKVIDREYAPAAERKSVPSTPFHFPLLQLPVYGTESHPAFLICRLLGLLPRRSTARASPEKQRPVFCHVALPSRWPTNAHRHNVLLLRHIANNASVTWPSSAEPFHKQT